MQDQKFYRVRAIAEMCSVAQPTVYAWIYRGLLKSVKAGRTVLVPADELERFLRGDK